MTGKSFPIRKLLINLYIGIIAVFSFTTAIGQTTYENTRVIRNVTNSIAVDNVCALPTLTLMADGAIIAALYNQPSKGFTEGDVVCYKSLDNGYTWHQVGTPAQHEPGSVRINHAAGLSNDGSLVLLCSGWSGRDLREYLLPILVCRSSDGGKTWVRDGSVILPENMPMLIPYGDVIRVNPELLAVTAYHGYSDSDQNRAYLLFSRDDGRTWENPATIGEVDHRDGSTDIYLNFNETSVLPVQRNRWLAAARSNIPNADIRLLVSENGGRYWKIPEKQSSRGITGKSEYPGHLLKLKDGRILLTYGIRWGEQGIGARISSDEGRTWSPPMAVIYYGGSDGGHPSSIQLADGTIVTAYYSDKNRFHHRYYMGVLHWKAPERMD